MALQLRDLLAIKNLPCRGYEAISIDGQPMIQLMIDGLVRLGDAHSHSE